TAVFGLVTNLPLLRAIAAHDDFAAGDFDTGWVERELEALRTPAPPPAVLAAAATAMTDAWSAGVRTARPHDPGSPWLGMHADELVFTLRGRGEPEYRARPAVEPVGDARVHGDEVQVCV